MTDRLARFLLVLTLALTLVPYVRRSAVPQGRTVTVVDGSRDRHLRGKARIRARRAH